MHGLMVEHRQRGGVPFHTARKACLIRRRAFVDQLLERCRVSREFDSENTRSLS